ncbi:MAG: hypothetical protein HUJ68_03080 [Clostridia bacterium]|nr:hypothetical protein [Clostridia bacterium]
MDIAAILLPVKQDDIIALETILNNGGFDKPNLRLTIYKNRRGQYKQTTLWCKANLGTCRIQPMFLTDEYYKFIPIENVKIQVSAF